MTTVSSSCRRTGAARYLADTNNIDGTMINDKQDLAINKTARVAGALYLLMAPFAAFSLKVRFSAFDHADAAQTVANIAAAPGQHLAAIVTWLVSQTLMIFLVVALYRLLRPVSKTYAALMAALGLVGIPISMLNEINQFAVLLWLSPSEFTANVDPTQIQANVMFFLHLHERGMQICHIFWGLWLLPFGYLVFKSKFLPRVLGILLVIAGIGYLVDLTGYLLFPGSNFTITPYTFIGELLLPLWLLIKGVRVEEWQRRAVHA